MLDRKSGDELTRNFWTAKFWGDSFWGDGNKCLLISDGAKMQTKEAILLKLHLVNRCVCSGHGCKHRWRDTSSRRDSKAAATPEVHQPGWDLGKAALPSVELSACAAGMPTGREALSGSSPVENLLSSAIIYCFYNLEDGPWFLYVSAFLDLWGFWLLLLLLLDLQEGCPIERRSPHNHIGIIEITRNILSPISQGLPSL